MSDAGHLSGDEAIAGNLAESVGEELMVEFVVELERCYRGQYHLKLVVVVKNIGQGITERAAVFRLEYEGIAAFLHISKKLSGIDVHFPFGTDYENRVGFINRGSGKKGVAQSQHKS